MKKWLIPSYLLPLLRKKGDKGVEEFVAIEVIKEVIEISKSITTLSSNECDMYGVEASEVCVTLMRKMK